MTRLFDAFVNFLDGQEPLLYYSNLSLKTEVVKTAFLIATLIISDILFVSMSSSSAAHQWLTLGREDLPAMDGLGPQLLYHHSPLLHRPWALQYVGQH